MVQEARSLLRDPDPRPLFLFVNLMAAHAPYTLAPAVPWSNKHRRMLHREHAPDWVKRYRADRIPPALALSQRPSPGERTGEEAFARGELPLSEFDLEFIRDLYDGELVRLDKAMVELVGAWNQSGRGQGIMAVTSDHGEFLGEHGLIGHGMRVFDEVTRVPLVIAAPGRLEPNTEIYTPVQMRDLNPTILDLTGVQEGAEGSLKAVIAGEPRPGPIQSASWPMPVFAKNVGGRYVHGSKLYREGSRAVIVDDDGQSALYDLSKDPSMTQPLDEPIEPWLRKVDGAFPESKSGQGLAVPDQALEQLKALGYVE